MIPFEEGGQKGRLAFGRPGGGLWVQEETNGPYVPAYCLLKATDPQYILPPTGHVHQGILLPDTGKEWREARDLARLSLSSPLYLSPTGVLLVSLICASISSLLSGLGDNQGYAKERAQKRIRRRMVEASMEPSKTYHRSSSNHPRWEVIMAPWKVTLEPASSTLSSTLGSEIMPGVRKSTFQNIRNFWGGHGGVDTSVIFLSGWLRF